ncbi:MAG: hypothetical protein WAS33_31185 [Candidatus Promineifilaceae bacterium]
MNDNLTTNASNEAASPAFLVGAVSRCFSSSDDEYTFSEKGFHGSLLCNIMGGIRDLTFYNVFDEDKKPIKVTSIKLDRGCHYLAYCHDEITGKRWYIHTGYLAVLK